MASSSPILTRMTYALALALLAAPALVALAREGTTGEHTHTPDVTAQTLPPPAGTPAPPPGPDADRPAIGKDEFDAKFRLLPDDERPSYETYANAPAGQRKAFESKFASFDPSGNVRKLDEAGAARELKEAKGRLSALKSTLRVQTAEETFSGDTTRTGEERPVGNEGPDPTRRPTRGTPTPSPARPLDSTVPPAPGDTQVEDKAPAAKSGPQVDEKFKSVLKNAALGAMAGAAIGIGLLPLFGPIGILVGAVLGAAMMIATKTLAG